ncbi:MAG: MlaD family protein [Bdellovibrionota bacterium]
MKIKFNLYERVAGLFVLIAVVGAIAATVIVAVKKGWFEDKIHLTTDLKNADGVREGTVVQMAGLRAGRVTHVALKSNNEIMVKFEVSERFADRVREDSVVRVIRPFIIGEKVLDISVGSEEQTILAENATVKSEPTMDIMDLVSGKTLGPSLDTLGKMMENLKFVAEELFDPERSKAIVQMFDDVRPLLRNANLLTAEAASMVKKMNKKDQMVRMVTNLAELTDELHKALPAITRESPQLASDLSKIAKNMAVLTDEVSKTLPLMKDLAPELPRASRRAIEALDETVVTLKALQKSFLLRGNVREVRTEERERDERKPASAPGKEN